MPSFARRKSPAPPHCRRAATDIDRPLSRERAGARQPRGQEAIGCERRPWNRGGVIARETIDGRKPFLPSRIVGIAARRQMRVHGVEPGARFGATVEERLVAQSVGARDRCFDALRLVSGGGDGGDNAVRVGRIRGDVDHAPRPVDGHDSAGQRCCDSFDHMERTAIAMHVLTAKIVMNRSLQEAEPDAAAPLRRRQKNARRRDGRAGDRRVAHDRGARDSGAIEAGVAAPSAMATGKPDGDRPRDDRPWDDGRGRGARQRGPCRRPGRAAK